MKAEEIESRNISGYGHNVGKKRVCIQDHERYEGFEIEPVESFSVGNKSLKSKDGDLINIKQEYYEVESKKDQEISKRVDAITPKKL